MSNELAIRENRELTPAVWGMIQSMAPVMHVSRLFKVSSPEAAAAIMLKGYELGLSITASFEFIQVIEGKPELTPRGALAMLHNSPLIRRIEITEIPNGHACTIERTNGFTYTATFTLEDAKQAGIYKPGGAWEKYSKNMTRWRAIGFAADVAAPDITGGLTGILKSDSMIIDGQGEIIKPLSLNDLLAEFAAEDVMNANGGNIPSTQDEIDAVYEVLKGGV